MNVSIELLGKLAVTVLTSKLLLLQVHVLYVLVAVADLCKVFAAAMEAGVGFIDLRVRPQVVIELGQASQPRTLTTFVRAGIQVVLL